MLRWKQINPKLLYFDCVFDDVNEMNDEQYLQMKQGLTAVHFSFYPDARLIKKRQEYFDEIARRNEKDGTKCSYEKIFQDEMLRTLGAVFKEDFGEKFILNKARKGVD